MSGQQFQQHPTQQQPPRFHNNNKSGAPNQNNNNGQATGSSSTTPNAATGISFEYSEPPGATTRTTPDSGLGTDDQKQANQPQNPQQQRVPPGFHQNRGHPQQTFYPQAMRPPPNGAEANGTVFYSFPPQQFAPPQERYEPQYAPPAGYNPNGPRAYRYSENSGYGGPEDSSGANNNFVIRGPNESFDGRSQYNPQGSAPQQQGPPQQPHMVPVNYDGHQGYGGPSQQGQIPQAQYYAGPAVIHQNQQPYQQQAPQIQFRGGPPQQQMVPMMQGAPPVQQTSVMYAQPQMVYPQMYAPVPVAVVTRQQPAATPEKGRVAKRNSQTDEETSSSPAQQQLHVQPNAHPPQQEFARNQMAYPEMMGYQNMTPQHAQMQHMQFQQMNAYGMNQAMIQQQQQHQQLQMNQAAAYHQGYGQMPLQQNQGRPGQMEPLMAGAPNYPMGIPTRGGFQQRGLMHPHNIQNNPMAQMGYFQAPTNLPQSSRGGRGRGRGGNHFHSRQNSGQGHYSSHNNQRGQYDGNRQTPSRDDVEALSTGIERLEAVSTEPATGSTVEREVKEIAEPKQEETEVEEHTNTTEEETSVETEESVKAASPVEKEEQKSDSVENDTHCYHCEYHEKPKDEISSHNIRKKNGELWCKDLQNQKCLHCEATGENGHHFLVCPKKKDEEKAEKEAEKKTRETSQNRTLSPTSPEENEESRQETPTPEPQAKSRNNSESYRGGGRHHGGNYQHNDKGGYRGRGNRGGRGGGYGRGGRGNNENKRH